MQKASIVDRIDVCRDCFDFLEGHEPDTDLDMTSRMEEIDSAYEARFSPKCYPVIAADDGEIPFSWSPCQLCGSPLGGPRFAYDIVERN